MTQQIDETSIVGKLLEIERTMQKIEAAIGPLEEERAKNLKSRLKIQIDDLESALIEHGELERTSILAFLETHREKRLGHMDVHHLKERLECS